MHLRISMVAVYFAGVRGYALELVRRQASDRALRHMYWGSSIRSLRLRAAAGDTASTPTRHAVQYVNDRFVWHSMKVPP
jgi:hypothetical protein